MKSHAMVFLEPSPNAIWIDPQGPNVRVGPARLVILIDRGQQRFQPLGRVTLTIHWPASLARTKSRKERITRRREELQLVLAWRPSRAAHPAENPCASNAGEEHTLIAGVSREESANQLAPFG
jgi:hypothetical protein